MPDSVLVTEMRRRGLWHSPPSFLGSSGAGWAGDALDELASDAYFFIFVQRLRGLRRQQQLKGNIRPMVILNVRNFLTERQAKADPLGYRVFGRLRKAVELGIERDAIFVLNAEQGTKKHRLGNGSLLGFQPGPAEVAPRGLLEAPVRRWNDDLLPELLTAEGRAVPAVVKLLTEKLLALPAAGVAALRFGDLIAELKDDTRKRWQGVWRGTLGELGKESASGGDSSSRLPPALVRIARPQEQPDWPRRLMLIQDCVAASIGRRQRLKNRRDLWRLWTLLRVTRVLPGEQGPLPSYTELGRQLALGRDRVRQLFEDLKPMVSACLRADAPLKKTEHNPPSGCNPPAVATGDTANQKADSRPCIKRSYRVGPRLVRPAGGRGERS